MCTVRALRDPFGFAAAAVVALLSVAVAGCGTDGAPDDGGSDDPAFLPADLTRTPPDLPVLDFARPPDLTDAGPSPDLAEPPSPCADGVKGGGETDIDCGGPDCAPCGDGLACAQPRDCRSGLCGGGSCSAPACNDGRRNGGETDTDCGGPTCPVCAMGKACVGAADCAGRACENGVCGALRFLNTLDFAANRALAGLYPNALRAADVDRDGKLDLVTPGFEGGVAWLTVSPGRGSGAFGNRIDTRLPAVGLSLAVGDVDGDGAPDALLGAADALYLAAGDGKGAFKAPVKYTASGGVYAVELADLDGDRDLDVAWIDPGTGSVKALFNDGKGTLAGRISASPCGAGAASYRALAAADLDDDGRAEVALACADGRVTLLSIVGGAFSAPVAYPLDVALGKSLIGLTAGDLDGDGHIDLAVGDVLSKRALVLWNAHVGAPPADMSGPPPDLTMPPPPDLAIDPADLALDDLGGDSDAGSDGGEADLAIPDLAAPADLASPPDLAKLTDLVVVDLLPPRDLASADGGGGVVVSLPFLIGPLLVGDVSPAKLGMADLTGDGRTDVAMVGEGGIDVFAGGGNRTFAALRETPAGNNPIALATGDWNGDGRIDLAVAHGADASVHILLQDNRGQLPAAPVFDTALSAVALVTADFDGDRAIDVALASAGAGVDVLPGRGDGTLGAARPVLFGSSLTALAAADLDGDGKLDLIGGDFGKAGMGGSAGVYTLLGAGNGTFLPALRFLDTVGVRALAASDLDGDGLPDVAAADFASGGVRLLMGGEGRGFPRRAQVQAAMGTAMVVPGDLDRDGVPELVTGNLLGGAAQVRHGRGGGAFDAAAAVGPPTTSSLALADLDGDGVLDLVVGADPATIVGTSITTLAGDGKGGFRNPLNTIANRAAAIALGDLDLDGAPDLAIVGGQVVAVLHGTGNGQFMPPLYFFAGRDPSGVSIADLDGDGRPDLCVSTLTSGVTVLRNTSR